MMDAKTLATLVDIDLSASKTCRMVRLYTVSLFEFMAAFETALELLAKETPSCRTALYWNAVHTLSAVAETDKAATNAMKELAIWFEYGNNYTIYDTSDSLHRCPLSIYQICTARVSQTVMDNTRIYAESDELFLDMKLRPTTILQPIYTYDYSAVKKYLQYATEPIENIICSKTASSLKTVLNIEKRYLQVFELLFNRSTLASVAQQYYAQGCRATLVS